MDGGHCTLGGETAWMDKQGDKISDQQTITTMVDALGNETEIQPKKKAMTKVEEKKHLKLVRKKLKDGIELDDDEMDFAIANELC